MDIMLAPDVYVNASIAPGSLPDRVVQRVLGQHRGEAPASEWVLNRVGAMLRSIPEFRADAVDGQVALIRTLVRVVDAESDFSAEAWDKALVAAAKAAGIARVITDHPDLLARETAEGVEFISTEAWLVEATTPPPLPV